jgi:hypothetical protein
MAHRAYVAALRAEQKQEAAAGYSRRPTKVTKQGFLVLFFTFSF